MAEPIRVTALRGETVESVHRVHAVAVKGGKVVAAAGDPGFVTFMRSAAKPIQAQPLARAREDLDDRDLAIASASHLADKAQLAAVQALLAKAPATEDDLECGPFQGSRLKHNCSGKHAGMLALCHAQGWPYEGYRLAEHPCQQAMLAEVAELAGTSEIPTAVDGCGVITFALPLERIAAAFTRIDERIAAAMRSYPELIRGPGCPGHESHAGAPGLDRQGRGRGTPLRSVSRGPRCGAESRGRHAPCATACGRVVSRPGRAGVRTRSGHEQPGRGCRSGN